MNILIFPLGCLEKKICFSNVRDKRQMNLDILLLFAVYAFANAYSMQAFHRMMMI